MPPDRIAILIWSSFSCFFIFLSLKIFSIAEKGLTMNFFNPADVSFFDSVSMMTSCFQEKQFSCHLQQAVIKELIFKSYLFFVSKMLQVQHDSATVRHWYTSSKVPKYHSSEVPMNHWVKARM